MIYTQQVQESKHPHLCGTIIYRDTGILTGILKGDSTTPSESNTVKHTVSDGFSRHTKV